MVRVKVIGNNIDKEYIVPEMTSEYIERLKQLADAGYDLTFTFGSTFEKYKLVKTYNWNMINSQLQSARKSIDWAVNPYDAAKVALVVEHKVVEPSHRLISAYVNFIMFKRGESYFKDLLAEAKYPFRFEEKKAA